ncbi:high-affinity nickel-transport protein-domain-containing protein [Xylaria sp. FL1042]|nr:high-affinity nickel-transport protein-domain-containing protein [Xylaria sp. FL1042]
MPRPRFCHLPPLPRRLRGLPAPVLYIISLLLGINAVIWAAVAVVLHYHPGLVGAAVLSYTLGLRHALDADHIAAIDLMTRRLVASGQRPVTVGTFFSLGHSTIVIVTCIVVAATAGALRERFSSFQYIGGIIGTSVSAAVLILLCLGNGWVLYRLIIQLRKELQEPDPHRPEDDDSDRSEARSEDQAVRDLQLDSPGFLTNILRGFFRIVDRPWKMYPLGVLFGLGFDTSSEIAVLGIASVQAAQGTSLWIILIFPLLFTGGLQTYGRLIYSHSLTIC